MNKWLLLLIVAGLAVAGWYNRDKISQLLEHKPAAAIEAAAATPNPATESRAMAMRTYPALGIKDSPFNRRFIADYNELATSDPKFLLQPDWPMQLAARTARELGAGALPASGMPPPPGPPRLAGSLLDHKSGPPPPPWASPTPSMLPGGLQGSSLDAPARSTHPGGH
jgi:hypothetical protein